jgi:hypothetical protein
MSDEERESDLGEWCSEHREFYTEGTPCPGCKVIREAYIRGAKDVLVELSSRLKVRPGEVGLRFANIYNTFLAEVATGDWPKGE